MSSGRGGGSAAAARPAGARLLRGTPLRRRTRGCGRARLARRLGRPGIARGGATARRSASLALPFDFSGGAVPMFLVLPVRPPFLHPDGVRTRPDPFVLIGIHPPLLA